MSDGSDRPSMHRSRRCGARTRKGTPCQAPAVQGKVRCRMHGGANGSGAPKGNRNALKTGLYTAEAIALRNMVRSLTAHSRKLLKELK